MITGRVNIGGIDWTIIPCDPREIGDDLGECLSDELVIKVSWNLKDDMKNIVILHEILHALVSQTGLADDFSKVSDDFEEKIVDRLAPILYSVLKNNTLSISPPTPDINDQPRTHRSPR